MNLYIIIGAYGSGKSEYSINLSQELNLTAKGKVVLVDLDVVNPYFRSRDVRENFANDGIEVVAPLGKFAHADLPMISPRIMSVIKDKSKIVILDVGGDPAGCRALARFTQAIKERGFEMKLVVNTNRPFTADIEGIKEMFSMLEDTTKLKISELICNTNLMEFTTEETVIEGIDIIQEMASHKKIKFSKYLVMEKYQQIISKNLCGKERIVMKHFLTKPWE